MPDNERKVSFRPRARLLSLLGEQLISDQAVGLIELVKNSYDADATHVHIKLENLADPKSTKITIRDNGFGMTIDDVESKWLSPAIDHKDRFKKDNQRTPRGRLPIGEKGVGRFAVHQLGHELTLITKSKNLGEVVLDVDWDDFDSGEMYLSDLTVPLVERSSEIFPSTGSGTVLEIRHARTKWNKALVSKLQKALKRLQSPHVDMEDFVIIFECPEYPELQNIDASDIIDRWHYRFYAIVDSNGQIDYEYYSNMPQLEKRTSKGIQNITSIASNELSTPIPQCGPFYVNFYVWDRTPNLLKESDISRSDLDALAGVALFRDGLRVLPYGESGNDWLDLDKERINDPSRKIGNQQIIGFIEIQQQETPQLRDKTNREGLIENAAFQDLRALVRAAINVFTTEWLQDRPGKKTKNTKQASQDKHTPLENLKQIATGLAESASPSLSVKIPDANIETETSGITPPSNDAEITQAGAINLLLEQIDYITELEKEDQIATHERETILMHLASTGIVAERVAHEFGRQVYSALSAISELRPILRGNAKGTELLEVLDVTLGTLRNEFKILAPYETTWRLQRTTDVDIGNAINLALNLNNVELVKHNVEVLFDGYDFMVRARPASLSQIFDNIIHNAIYWLSTKDQNSRKQLRISMNSSDRSIHIYNNGPRISKNMYEHIFEPFVSMKNGGRGLGLYIVRELLKDLNASISISDVDLDGEIITGFTIKFSE